MHVLAYVELLGRPLPHGGNCPSLPVKQHLAALRMLFDWRVVGQIIAHNPAHAVREPWWEQWKWLVEAIGAILAIAGIIVGFIKTR